MKRLSIFLLLALPSLLNAYTEPRTEYTEDRYFVTTGELDFPVSPDEVSMVMLKYNDYDLWALKGMQGVDKESEGLLVYFTAIEYVAGRGMFLVNFDVNLIWPFGRKDSVLKMKTEQHFGSGGELESVTFIPIVGSKMVEDARIEFRIRKTAEGTAIFFESRIKLSKFLDFFFSLRSYKKNFEWYVFKVAGNFADYVMAYSESGG